jgi:hypothetical protein
VAVANLFTSQTPSGTNNADGAPGIITSTSFIPAVNGTVTGIRFRATSTVGGTYTGALHVVTAEDDPGPGAGTLLGSAVLSGSPTASAWNTIPLGSPVAVTAGTLYRVALHNDQGRYVNTTSFFIGADLVNGDLTAPADGSGAFAGALRNGSFEVTGTATQYPNNYFSGSSYFIDVEFTAGGAAISRTVDDPTGLADTVAAASALGRAVTDGAGLTDTQGRQHGRTVTDLTGTTDTTVRVSGHGRTHNDGAGLTDPITVVAGYSRTQTDGTGMTDAIGQQLFTLITRTVTDALGLADANEPQAFDVAEPIIDGIGLTDAVTPVLTPAGGSITRTVDDLLGLADAAARLSAFVRPVTDGAVTADAVSAQLAGAGTRQVDESAGLTDAVAAALTASRAVTDAAGLTDGVIASLNSSTAHVRTINDSVGLTSSHRVKRRTHRPNRGITPRYALVSD